MVALRDAITKAKEYICEAYSDDPPKDLHLEEVRRSEDDSTWEITVGFRAFSVAEAKNGMARITTLFPEDPYKRYPREYKVVTIDSATGEVLSMTNRE